MSSRASLAFLILIFGAATVPATFAAADTPSAAQKAAAAKKKQQQAAAAKAAQAKKQQEDKEWYAKDRDRGLDIAAEYAPNEIARVRKNNYIAKGDSVSTGNGKKGWRQYMDKYYSR